MKQSQAPYFMALVFFLVSCSKPANTNVSVQVNSASNSSGAQTKEVTNSKSVNFSKVFDGAINGSYSIEMNLQRDGQNLQGTYFYVNHKVDISIKGTVDGQGNLVLNEFDQNGNQTGIFKGHFTSSSTIEGTWSKPNGDKSMPFYLNEKGSGSVEAASNQAAPATESQPVSTPQSRTELSRETVLSLVRGRYNKEVTVGMNTSSNVYGKGNITDLYTRMIQAKIISCPKKEPSLGGCGCWTGCTPGSNSHGLRMSEQGNGIMSGSMSLTVGYKVPSQVNGISRIDQASAYADVIFTFESNSSYSFYTQWSDAFWRPPDTQSEQHRYLLRLYDDGWRIERSLS